MTRYICIHGHFYQPPRESPWTDTIEAQPSAAPFPNWNHRIAFECYEANTKAAILREDGAVQERINNYGLISYNFGPTLLRWMKKHTPHTHEQLVEADKKSVEHFGYGTALAQVFHHSILPLCNKNDKRTEVIWGKDDFIHRYGRKPDGMWLAETAADTETLEVLAEQGILFTILAPEQCKRFRPIGWKEWREGPVDTSQPYLIRLPSGASITVFFYHGDLAQDVAFRGALNNGERFARKIISTAKKSPEGSITHYATDGESYGHHHRYGEMALAYCLRTLSESTEVEITNYASYLAHHPPAWEAEIHEPSAWSCAHGVGRWSENCGCVIDPQNKGKQEWRKILRSGLNWLRDAINHSYLLELDPLVASPWKLRDGWLKAQLNDKLDEWIERNALRQLSSTEHNKIVSLLDIQTYMLQMFTSCGWFFDYADGIEPVQILRYAARAIELHKQVLGEDLEEEFLNKISTISSLNPKISSGFDIWVGLVHEKRS
jgi:alpha-amylase/alpha-mannosidase (GH57 family)